MTLSDQMTEIRVSNTCRQLERFVDGLADLGRADLVSELQPALELMASAEAELQHVRDILWLRRSV